MNKKRATNLLLAAFAILAALPVLALLFTDGSRTEVDYNTLIKLPTGPVPLSAIVTALEPEVEGARTAMEENPRWSEQEQVQLETWLKGANPDSRSGHSLYDLGREALEEGRIEQGVALLRSIPRDDRRYSRAQRYLGWDVYTRLLDEPEQGLPFMLASIRSSPFEGNVWQDMYRVSFRAMTPTFLR